MSNTRRTNPIQPRPLPSPYADVLDAVSTADRAYFEAHPKRTSYTRPVVAGEFGDQYVRPGALVTVTKVADGVRSRRVLG